MQVTLLVMHRKERYPGEYAPEVLAVVDEVTLEENPQWWEQETAKRRAQIKDANAWAEISLELPDDAVMGALYPRVHVPATVTGCRSLPADPDGGTPTPA